MKTLMILCTVPDERLEMVLMEAKKAGYKTLFCGEKLYSQDKVPADIIYKADWGDIDQLLYIATKRKIDGVIGLCDPAAIPAAKIAETLNLPGNSAESVEKLMSKNKFRILQEKSGVFYPKYAILKNADDFKDTCGNFKFPLIIKPALSSSSHGMTVVYNVKDIGSAFFEAAKTSRDGTVCIEEYIENKNLRVIESDIFVIGEDIIWDGIRYCYRLPQAPLRPVYDVYPVSLSKPEIKEYRRSVAAVIKESGAAFGEFNVEGFFTDENRFFIVEINPRPAGHYTPQTVQFYTGINLAKLLVTTAVGDNDYLESLKDHKPEHKYKYLLDHSVFSEKDGVFKGIHIDEKILPCLKKTRFLHGQKEGDRVRNIIDAIRPIAVMIFAFDTKDELEFAREHITELVYPIVDED